MNSIWAIAIAIVVLGIVFGIYTGMTTATDEKELAICLTEKGYSMAGASWCSHCNAQKELFGENFHLIDYHDCDEEADWCQEKGIAGYPSWIAPEGAILRGVHQLSDLKELTGC